MALALTTITNSIAALSVSGVTIFDIDEVPSEIGPRAPAIIPLPMIFDNFTVQYDSMNTSSGTDARKKTVTYDLHYRLLYAPIGTDRGNILSQLSAMATKAGLFLDAVMAVDTFTGGIDIDPSIPEGNGIVEDPAGVPFWGCDFVLTVMEFVN